MGWLPSSYFALFLAFSAWSFCDDLKNGVRSTRLVVEVLSDAGLICVSLAYWYPSLQILVGTAAPLIFCLALAGFIMQLIATIRRQLSDTELSHTGKVFVLSTGTFLVAIVSAPLLYWGFSAAVLRRYAGT
jgi:hypothetical protein